MTDRLLSMPRSDYSGLASDFVSIYKSESLRYSVLSLSGFWNFAA